MDAGASVRACRLHILGASGCGVTTLGAALASAWVVPHADADDYFWEPTTPPYTTKRDVADSVRLMREMFLGRDAWVLSGSFTQGGDPLISFYDAVVFLSADTELRLERIRSREAVRWGAPIEPGGERETFYRDFLAWSARYDDPDFDGRSRARHERWLSALTCPVLRLDGARPVDELVSAIGAWSPAAD